MKNNFICLKFVSLNKGQMLKTTRKSKSKIQNTKHVLTIDRNGCIHLIPNSCCCTKSNHGQISRPCLDVYTGWKPFKNHVWPFFESFNQRNILVWPHVFLPNNQIEIAIGLIYKKLFKQKLILIFKLQSVRGLLRRPVEFKHVNIKFSIYLLACHTELIKITIYFIK